MTCFTPFRIRIELAGARHGNRRAAHAQEEDDDPGAAAEQHAVDRDGEDRGEELIHNQSKRCLRIETGRDDRREVLWWRQKSGQRVFKCSVSVHSRLGTLQRVCYEQRSGDAGYARPQ